MSSEQNFLQLLCTLIQGADLPTLNIASISSYMIKKFKMQVFYYRVILFYILFPIKRKKALHVYSLYKHHYYNKWICGKFQWYIQHVVASSVIFFLNTQVGSDPWEFHQSPPKSLHVQNFILRMWYCVPSYIIRKLS